MEEVQERDLISRSEVYKLFEKDGTAKLHVAQIDQLPAVDVMKLPTVQRLEKELEQAKLSLAIARLGEIAKKSAPKIRPVKKVKPLAKGHADGKVTVIHIVDEWAAAGPKHTPPRRIRPELNPGDVVTVESGMYREKYREKRFLVIDITGGVAELTDADTRSRHWLEEVKNLKLVSRYAQPGGKEQ